MRIVDAYFHPETGLGFNMGRLHMLLDPKLRAVFGRNRWSGDLVIQKPSINHPHGVILVNKNASCND